MSAVALRQATVALGGRAILDAASFELAEGEFVALLGPNGAGKTTLLRAILGLLPVASGTIEVFGRRPARGDRRIGYLPQARAVAKLRLRGRDLVAVAAGPDGWGASAGGRAARNEADWALAMAGAGALAERSVASLSGGQLQRLMLAQALLGRPRLLLLDEPLISLDLPAQRDVVALAARLSRELPATVLFSAHELTPLLGHVDRILYLGHGQAAIGTVDEIIRPEILSRLYGGPVEVVRAAGRLFVVSGDGPAHDGHGH